MCVLASVPPLVFFFELLHFSRIGTGRWSRYRELAQYFHARDLKDDAVQREGAVLEKKASFRVLNL